MSWRKYVLFFLRKRFSRFPYFWRVSSRIRGSLFDTNRMLSSIWASTKVTNVILSTISFLAVYVKFWVFMFNYLYACTHLACLHFDVGLVCVHYHCALIVQSYHNEMVEHKMSFVTFSNLSIYKYSRECCKTINNLLDVTYSQSGQ